MNGRHRIYKTKSVGFLAAGMVLTVAWAISATGWVKDGLDIVVYVGLAAVIIGLMLARSLLPGSIAHLFSIVIGVACSFWTTSRLLPDQYTWPERWEDLMFRLNYWYNQAIQGGVSHDNLMFILQMGVIVWAMGYLTIWFVFRSGKVWHAIVPGGLVLIINLYYAPKDITFWFLIYLLLSLLLVIRFNLFNQEAKWRTEGVFFQPDISFDFLRDGLIFSALVIGLAWITPPVLTETPDLFEEFQGTWHDLQSHWNRLYADLNYRDPGQIGTFGQSFTLGGPRQLTDEPIMDVNLTGGSGGYWRATVYDEYTGLGWRNTDEASATFGPEDRLALPVFDARYPVTQTYTFYHDGSVALYAINHPIRLDRSAKVTFNAIPSTSSAPGQRPSWSGSEGPWVEEITYIRSNAAVDRGESYRVVSAASGATVEQLQTAGAAYPAWVTERYLQIPSTVTARTRQLARELTAPFDNPFAQAEAIERYLRNALEYNEQIDAPPPEVDKVDYILFELKQAYCDYYASAMVIMLRAEGIPARLAVGFAQGDFDREQDVFHVVNADAHSWVEVYFPKYGWVEFEPTAAQPRIVRPIAADDDSALADNGPAPENLPESDRIPGHLENIPIDEEIGGGQLPLLTLNLSWLGFQISIPRSSVKGGLTFMGVVLLAGLAGAGFWWCQQQSQAAKNIFSLYQNMVRLAGWMGAALRPWHTPYEHTAIIQRHLPAHQHEVETITKEYVHQTFSPAGAKNRDAAQPVAPTVSIESSLAWRRLRPEMIKLALKRRWPW
ncbi:MAG: transglutaminase domain-containing protein [Anaerolineae bacterium]|nr:transglutaminase domain-containing protein [Anaerolineae bacterium]